MKAPDQAPHRVEAVIAARGQLQEHGTLVPRKLAEDGLVVRLHPRRQRLMGQIAQ